MRAAGRSGPIRRGMTDMVEVVVAIPTFRRPKSLERLLDALERLRTDARVSVIVADNDAAAHEGADICARRAPVYRWPLSAVVVEERGIAQVRNALVEAALADSKVRFVAMIDDDEWPSPEWLDAFLKIEAETGADVVQGSILFPASPDPSYARCEGIASIRRPTGIVHMVQGTGNILIARRCLESMERPWFDPDFALSGGEDQEFFVRLSKAGRRFAWADSALAYGELVLERMNWKWVLKRAYGSGNSDMRVAIKYGSGPLYLAGECAKILGAFIVAPVLSLSLAFVPARRLEGPRLFFRAAGKATAILGLRYEPYGVTHGE
jgi:succinoglycan biosynthesis protein ExoM